MIINKFGGASIKDVESINRMVQLCKTNIQSGILVVSAMGKTTNLLEKITLNYFRGESYSNELSQFSAYHLNIMEQLFQVSQTVYFKFNQLFDELNAKLAQKPDANYDFEYDQIVPFGELASTLIFSEYLNQEGVPVSLIDIRRCLKTNKTYRNAKIDWQKSADLVLNEFTDTANLLYLTQGFVGADATNFTTTLGREGSDFTAAAIANLLNADKVVVWKDVPGILCADPDWLPNTPKIEQLSYLDAIELAFYGAKVIHPKTIKPLQNKKIPLQVRSFLNLNDSGTFISSYDNLQIPPVYIKKENQVLISIKPTDYSFIIEENLSHIFGILAKNQIAVNLMQNSAISFSISVDNDMFRVKKVIKELKEYYDVKYNDNLELLTIRHNKPGAEDLVLKNKTILVEQRSRTVARFLVR
jgi:aspartate kinase